MKGVLSVYTSNLAPDDANLDSDAEFGFRIMEDNFSNIKNTCNFIFEKISSSKLIGEQCDADSTLP